MQWPKWNDLCVLYEFHGNLLIVNSYFNKILDTMVMLGKRHGSQNAWFIIKSPQIFLAITPLVIELNEGQLEI